MNDRRREPFFAGAFVYGVVLALIVGSVTVVLGGMVNMAVSGTGLLSTKPATPAEKTTAAWRSA